MNSYNHSNHKLIAILFDCGDTLINEDTEVKDAAGIVLAADLIPGAGEMVHLLKEQGYPLGLVADGYVKSFTNILGFHELLDLFDSVSISEQVGVTKPHSDIFLNTLKELNIDPSDYHRVVMIGNNLSRDIKGANELGLISVWLDWSPHRAKIPSEPSEKPDYTIKAPMQLIPLLTELEGKL